MDKKITEAINDQLNYELYSGYIYLAMAAYFDSTNLPGFAVWMKAQAQEEVAHAMKFYEYLNDRGSKVTFAAVPKPAVSYTSVQEVFKKALAHEQSVTKRINEIYEAAKKAKDSASEIMLQWFITEQVEEEKNVSDILAQLEMVKANSPALLMLDRALSKRGKQ